MGIPNVNQNMGAAEQATAANASMIVSGMEKDLNKGKIKVDFKEKQINMEQLDKFVKKLTDTSKVNAIKKEKEKKGGQSKHEKKKRSVRPRTGSSQAAPHGRIFTAGELDKFQHNKKIDPKLLQKFSVLYSKSLLKTIDQAEEKELEKVKKEIGLVELLDILMTRVEDYIFDELAFQIKKALLNQLKSPKRILEFIVKFKTSSKLLNLAFFNEIIKLPSQTRQTGLAEKLIEQAAKKNIAELLKVAKELGIESQSWIKLLKIDRVKINEQGELVIDNTLLKAEREKELLLDEYRLLEVENYLGDNWKEKIAIYFRLIKIKESLLEIGTSREEINEVKTQARRLAWAKTIANLKEEHLKRVFSSSREFGRISKKIKKMTVKTRKLGWDISTGGVKWIETRLEKLAYESANYKLQLLKSMQSLGFDKQREKDVNQLSFTVEKLKQNLKAGPTAYEPAV